MEALAQHVLEELALGDASAPEGRPSVALGGASHIKANSAEGIARKYMLNLMGKPPEIPEAGMYGATATQVELVKEKAEHRFVIYLKSLGQTTQEIAANTGYCEVHVRQILAQPWARQQLTRLLESSDPARLIPSMIAQAAAKSIEVLLDIRDNPKAADSVRAKVCDSLLDRFLGKAVQQVQLKQMRPEAVDDADIEQRLKELETAEREVLQRPKLRESADPEFHVVGVTAPEGRQEAGQEAGLPSAPTPVPGAPL